MLTSEFRLGLTNILGIVAPGGLLLAGVVVAAVGVNESRGFHGYKTLLAALAEKDLLFTTSGLLVGYLLGSAIRLFANDAAEICSGAYLRRIRRRRTALSSERFPYPVTSKWIAASVGSHVVDFLTAQSPTFGSQGDKNFYNYCKMFVRANSPDRADYLEAIESYVRFLAGSFVSSALTAAMCAPLAVVFIAQGRSELALAYLFLFVTTLLIVISVLERFRHQHTREVVNTWLAYYACAAPPDRGRAR